MDRRYQKAGTEDFERAFELESGLVLDRFFERWIYGSGIPRLRYSTAVLGGEVRVVFEQTGGEIFDVPVTVTISYADGQALEVVVPVTDARVERTIPTTGVVRRVEVNDDGAALAEFDRR
jgi:aminopeptidase N